MKDSVEETDIETTILMSKLAIEIYATSPDACKCPVTHKIMVEPVMLVNSGHTYERKTLYRALPYKPDIDPLNNGKFDGEVPLKVNYSLKKATDKWIEKQESLIMNPPTDDSMADTMISSSDKKSQPVQ